MNVSYALVRLSAIDILEILEEFVSINGVKIEDINIKDIITIKGKYTKKAVINFSIELGVGSVKDDEIIVKILKVKMGILRIALSLIHLIFRKLLQSFEDYGVQIKNKHIIINIKKIQELIPVTTFDIKSIKVQNGFIEVEGKNIQIKLDKEYKTIEAINEEFKKERLQKKAIIDDTYSKLRNDIIKKIPQNFKEVSPYFLLIPDFVMLIIRLFKDKRVHIKEKVFLGFVGAYLLFPGDLISDFVPGIGTIDDIYIIFYAIERIIKNIPQEIVLENWEGDPKFILNSSEMIKSVFEVLGVENSKTLFKAALKKVLIKKKRREKGVR